MSEWDYIECDKRCMFGEIGDSIQSGKIVVLAANCPLMDDGEHEKIFELSDLYNANCQRARYANDHLEELLI